MDVISHKSASAVIPKILYIDQSGSIGGAELSLLDIVRLIPGTVLLFEDGPFRDRLEEIAVPVVVHKASGGFRQVRRSALAWNYIRAVPSFFPLLFRVIHDARDYDIIYVNTEKAMIVGALASLILGKPLIWGLRDLLIEAHFSLLNRRLAVALGSGAATAIVANSMATKLAYLAAGGDAAKCEVVYNGIEDPSDLIGEPIPEGIPTGVPLIGNFSRLSSWKGQDVLLRALLEIDQAHALFVGDALFDGDREFAETLRNSVEMMGLRERVHWLGFRKDVAALMGLCSVVVHSSTSAEPFGRVIVEAMLAEKPVIATALGGAMEIVEDGISGLLIRPGDSAALAAAIKKCLREPVWAAEVARNGRLRALQFFSIKSTTQRLQELFIQTHLRKQGRTERGDGIVGDIPPTTPARVLFLDQSGQLGGAELMLADIARRFLGNGEVLLFADGPYRDYLAWRGIQVSVCRVGKSISHFKRASGPWEWLKTLPGFVMIVGEALNRSSRYDLIYANTAKALFVGAVVALIRGRPLIFHLHDLVSEDHFSRLNRYLIVRAASSCAAWIIANSEATRRQFIAAGGRSDRNCVIYNGFDCGFFDTKRRFRGEEIRTKFRLDDRPLVVVVGRLTPWKGQHVLLDAARNIPELNVLVVGGSLFTEEDRDYEMRLRAEAVTPDLCGRVHFAGHCEDILSFYRAADVVVHCSTAPEPFGRVIVEAMLAGCPVIAADAGGVREIVTGPELGVLVPPGDARALESAIRGLLKDRTRAADMAEKARKEAERRFALPDILAQIDKVISSTVVESTRNRA